MEGASKQREMETKELPYALTKYSSNADNDSSNLSLLKEFVEIQEHLQLLVHHEVLLRNVVVNTGTAKANGTAIDTEKIWP